MTYQRDTPKRVSRESVDLNTASKKRVDNLENEREREHDRECVWVSERV